MENKKLRLYKGGFWISSTSANENIKKNIKAV